MYFDLLLLSFHFSLIPKLNGKKLKFALNHSFIEANPFRSNKLSAQFRNRLNFYRRRCLFEK